LPVANGSAFRAPTLDALKERNRVPAYQDPRSYELTLASTGARESGSFAGELRAIERGDAA
jgi:hypothetical protein